MYYLILIISSLFSLGIVYALYLYCTYPSLLNADQQKNRRASIDQTVILWDIHGVLFTKSIPHWIYLFVTYKRLGSAIWHLNMPIIILFLKYIAAKLKLSSQEITNEEMIAVARQAKNDALVELTILISCDYKPNLATIAIVQQLHAKNFIQHIGSNIGASIFTHFFNLFPSVFNLFQSHFVIKIIPGQPIYKKPLPNFFTRYMKEHTLTPKQIIFIDDNLANVYTAQTLGITALLYTTPQQLQADLVALGLF